MKLRLAHVSDTHGHFSKLRGAFDLIVHSGDFMPNRFDQALPDPSGKSLRGVPYEEEEFQTDWLDRAAPLLKEWVNGKKFIFCPGNHDFIDPIPRLRAEGIDAHNIAHSTHWHDGVPFVGFPYCPYDVRPWNYAITVQDMQREVARLKERLKEAGEEAVLVAHCPPANILDMSRGTHYGNTSLETMLSYDLVDVPMAILCGHIHGNHGVTYEDGMLISNAATTVHNITLTVSDG